MNKLNLSTLLTVVLLFTPLLFVSCKVFNNEIEIEGEVFITTKSDGSVENPMSAEIVFFPKKALLELAENYAVLNGNRQQVEIDALGIKGAVIEVISHLFDYGDWSDHSKTSSYFHINDIKLVKEGKARVSIVARDGKFSQKLLIGDYLAFIKAFNANEGKYYMWGERISVDREGSIYKFPSKNTGKQTALVVTEVHLSTVITVLTFDLNNDFVAVFKKVDECLRGIDGLKDRVDRWRACAN